MPLRSTMGDLPSKLHSASIAHFLPLGSSPHSLSTSLLLPPSFPLPPSSPFLFLLLRPHPDKQALAWLVNLCPVWSP